MNNLASSACGLGAAVLVPVAIVSLFALVLGGPRDAVLVGTSALVVTVGHVAVLGVPTILLLFRLHLVRVWSFALSGFIAGCIPMAVWSWPVDHSNYPSSFSYWSGTQMVAAKINGIPTQAGWIDYLQGVGVMGLFGLTSAIVCWAVFRRLSPN